jgi:anti-sigma B factor antagonist
MDAKYDQSTILREEIIARYLARQLALDLSEEFESHFLVCQDCYEEVRAAEILIRALEQTSVECIRNHGVTVIRFNGSTQLTGSSSELNALAEMVRFQGDTRVLIDLSGVSRIDSAGLGTLMGCYTHALRSSGALKLLNPSNQVKRVLSMTHIDAVVPTFDDEGTALASFE